MNNWVTNGTAVGDYSRKMTAMTMRLSKPELAPSVPRLRNVPVSILRPKLPFFPFRTTKHEREATFRAERPRASVVWNSFSERQYLISFGPSHWSQVLRNGTDCVASVLGNTLENVENVAHVIDQFNKTFKPMSNVQTYVVRARLGQGPFYLLNK